MNTDIALTIESPPTASEVRSNNGFEPRWFAVHTRSRHEKSASEQLRGRQIETFLPIYQSTRRWRNGDHEVQLPLFPGYTFVHIPLKDRLHVLKVPGVVRLVGFNGAPVPLEDQEVEGLRCALVSGIKAAPHPYLTVGRRVRITAGPLNGQHGILVRRKGALRVILSIELIQRSVLIDLSANEIEPAG
ncbi:MAG TPA: UpxY family transcription antiterminator [Candidatus Acidoferrales bacterium]|nr:UpxY family transcription antiterminator [Candidatus Acidoferrales bacterium]